MGTFADETIQFTPRGGVSNTEIAEAVLPLATYQDSESTVADIAQQIDDKLECIQLGCDVFTLEPAYDRGMYWTIRLYGEVGYSIFQNHLDAVFLNLVKLCDEAVANDWVDDENGGGRGRSFYGSKPACAQAKFDYHLTRAIDELTEVCRPEVDEAIIAIAKLMRSN